MLWNDDLLVVSSVFDALCLHDKIWEERLDPYFPNRPTTDATIIPMLNALDDAVQAQYPFTFADAQTTILEDTWNNARWAFMRNETIDWIELDTEHSVNVGHVNSNIIHPSHGPYGPPEVYYYPGTWRPYLNQLNGPPEAGFWFYERLVAP